MMKHTHTVTEWACHTHTEANMHTHTDFYLDHFVPKWMAHIIADRARVNSTVLYKDRWKAKHFMTSWSCENLCLQITLKLQHNIFITIITCNNWVINCKIMHVYNNSYLNKFTFILTYIMLQSWSPVAGYY